MYAVIMPLDFATDDGDVVIVGAGSSQIEAYQAANLHEADRMAAVIVRVTDDDALLLREDVTARYRVAQRYARLNTATWELELIQ